MAAGSLAATDGDLPPRELWPDYVYRLPELAYPERWNLADALLQHASGAPEKTAIRFRGESTSYAALRRRTVRLAASLVRLGVKPADRVCLRLRSSPDFIAAWLAIQWLGAICVQMPLQYRRREIEAIINHSGVSVLVCDAGFLADAVSLRRRVGPQLVVAAIGATEEPARIRDAGAFDLDDQTIDAPDLPQPYPSRRDQPAVITYLNGADGALKGAVHSPAEIRAGADTYARHVLALSSSDVCIGTTSMAWAFGLGALLTFPLLAGATTVLADGPMPVLQAIADEHATIFFSVPTMYRMLLQQPDLEKWDLRSLRCCVSAAEPLPADVVERWRTRTGLDIVDGFGTTELTHIVISGRPGNARPGFIGTVVDGFEARIVDSEMREVPDGTAGLLAVRGPTGARYWRDHDAQRRAVRHGWTMTGDICVRHGDGWFQHVSRSDALVVSAGYKIAGREVERVLEEHPAVASAHVFAVPDPIRGAVTHAVVVAAAGVEKDGLSERLQQYLKAELAPFKCPREIRVE